MREAKGVIVRFQAVYLTTLLGVSLDFSTTRFFIECIHNKALE